jgi:DNA-binding NarL/FixJ family response regulator
VITILLADDHPVILRGLFDLFGAHDDLKVVGKETDAREVVGAVARLRPDVLIMDLMMPGLSGMEIIREVTQHHPATRIVVLSMHSNVAYVWEALRNGALGYVLKCAEGEELVRAVHEVAAGRRCLSPPLSETRLDEYAKQVQQRGLDPHDMLTNRERQVLQLAAEGTTSSRIAELLHISVRTVESHRANLLLKLGLHNQTELVRYAIQRGLIPPG